MKPYYVMGMHCIDELLKHTPERIRRVFATKNALKKNISTALTRLGVPVFLKEKHFLTKMVGSESHQSLIAEVDPLPMHHLKDFLLKTRKSQKSCLLLLDSINDPQNLGSIFRAAECFQVDAVIYSKNRGVDITPVVSKVSSGASEFIPIIKVSNLAQSIPQLQQEGYEVMATDVDASAANLFTHHFSQKTALVIGSEGRGVQPLILKKCDTRLYIPMFGKIDSLNVSQATSVILSHFAKQIHFTK